MNNLVKYIHNNVAYFIWKPSLDITLEQSQQSNFDAHLELTLKMRSEYVLDLRTNEVLKARYKLEDLFDTLLKEKND